MFSKKDITKLTILGLIGTFLFMGLAIFISMPNYCLSLFNKGKNTTLIVKENSIDSTRDLIRFILDSRSQGHLKSFTFVQETIRYDEFDKPTDTSTWYEAIRYPKDFRIDFGDPSNGNANINRNDSIHVYRGNKLVHSGKEIQEFLLLEGGIFYYSVDETIEKLKHLDINTDVFTKSNYNGKDIYIIGSVENDYTQPQVWLDTKDLYVVRRFSKGKKGELYEVRYDDFKDFDGHKIETWIEFYAKGKLIQTERYNDIDVQPKLNDTVFDPNYFGKYYWFKKNN